MTAPLTQGEAAEVEDYAVPCDSGDGEQLIVTYRHRRADDAIVAAVGIVSPKKRPAAIFMDAGAMRKLAAELLNRADAIEGIQPLLWIPPNAPTATYPPGHPSA